MNRALLAFLISSLLGSALARSLAGEKRKRVTGDESTLRTTPLIALNRRAVELSNETKGNASVPVPAPRTVAARGFPTFPVYGRNCGPGIHSYSSAIDQLDWGCWDHDNCYYDENGNYEWGPWPLDDWVYCDCDAALIRRADRERRYGSFKKKAVAFGLMKYFQWQMWYAGC